MYYIINIRYFLKTLFTFSSGKNSQISQDGFLKKSYMPTTSRNFDRFFVVLIASSIMKVSHAIKQCETLKCKLQSLTILHAEHFFPMLCILMINYLDLLATIFMIKELPSIVCNPIHRIRNEFMK